MPAPNSKVNRPRIVPSSSTDWAIHTLQSGDPSTAGKAGRPAWLLPISMMFINRMPQRAKPLRASSASYRSRAATGDEEAT